MTRRCRRAWPLVLAALALAPNAFAQTDPVVAQALFDEAKDMMRRGDFSSACPKLAESERLDPGVGTLLNLGECWDRVGKPSRAWATFREAEAMAAQQGQRERSRYAADRAVELEGKLVRLTIRVPEAVRIPGLEVSRDHERVNEPLWGTAVPVDPGEHVIEARAPGYETFTARVTASRDPVVVDLVPLEPAPPPPPPPVAPPASPPAPAKAPAPALVATPRATAASSGGVMRTGGFVLGAAGLAGVGLGSLFGVLAIDRDNTSRAAGCSSTTCPTQGGLDVTHEAVVFATAANVTFVVSAVLLVTGVVFVLAAPRSPAARAAQALLHPWSFQ